MTIHFSIRNLDEKSLRITGDVNPEELEIESPDPLIHGTQALHYDLEGEKLGENLLVRGKLEIVFDASCSRCLEPFPLRITLPDWACHLPLTGDEKVAIECDSVNLTPYIREDVLLELPQHPCCGKDCRGIEYQSESEGSPVSSPLEGSREGDPSAWSVLDQLKLK